MRSLIAGLVLAACCSIASAEVIISNIDDTSGGGTLFGENATTIYKAAGFTMGSDSYFLDSVSLAIAGATDGSTAHVQIWEGEDEPQNMLQDLTDFSFPPGDGVYTWTPNVQLVLNADTTYWVYVDNIFEPGDSFLWDSGSTEPTGAGATNAGYIFNDNPSTFLNAYEVQGTVVPEPAGLALLAVGAMFTRRRR